MVGEGWKTVVIVDDNPRALASLTRVVSRGGFAPSTFDTLAASLHALEESSSPPAGAMIDIYLERGRHGFELCDRLRERFGATVPIVMITGYDPGSLPSPYWSPSETTEEHSHFLGERVPVYEKPLNTVALSAFFVRAAVLGRLRRSPGVLREAVVAYALQRRLTPQEARLLACLAAGSTRSSLPSDLGLSNDTVKSQIRNTIEKCDVDSTDELTAALLKYISEAAPSFATA